MERFRKRLPKNFFNRDFWMKVLGYIFFTGAFVYIFWYNGGGASNLGYSRPKSIRYSDFLVMISKGGVKSVSLSHDGEVYGIANSGVNKEDVTFTTLAPDSKSLAKQLQKEGIDFEIVKQDSWSFWAIFIVIISLVLLILLISALFSFLRSLGNAANGGGGSNRLWGGIAKSRAKYWAPGTVGVKFSDVAGAGEVKEELRDIVEFLKNPAKFERLGGKIPRGVLLVGNPGNGKTLLAKAVAGEANCPFFSISGSDFVEVFVGVGASRVRDLFKEARKVGPSIIFVDEIDSIGRQRGYGFSGGSDEREQTLNQILSEMDGFDTEPGFVIVIAATNRQDILDTALTRPGRFDRIVKIDYPDIATRKKILQIHSKNVRLSPDVDIEKIARQTPGFSGADLANLINEAALSASKNGNADISPQEIENAHDKITIGTKNSSSSFSPDFIKRIAVHEAGHTMVMLLVGPKNLKFNKVSIVSRGRTGGHTAWIQEHDAMEQTFDYFRRQVMVCFGSVVAEELVYGSHCSGAAHDLATASRIARACVSTLGMSASIGPVSVDLSKKSYGGMTESEQLSEAFLEKVDNEVERLLKAWYAETQELLKLESNREKLDKLSKALMEKEIMDEKEVRIVVEMQNENSDDQNLA